jgi:hypothetical protein
MNIDKLQRTLENLETNRFYKRLSPKRKKLIARIAAVHANDDASAPDNVAASMRRERRKQVKVASAQIATVLDSVGTRGAAALSMVSDSEWDSLINGTIEG